MTMFVTAARVRGPAPDDATWAAPRPPAALPRLRDAGFGALVIIIYLVMTRIGGLDAAKIGFQAGPLPMFLTDIVLFTLLANAFMTHSPGLIVWVSSGGQADVPGRLIWVLFIVSGVYLAFAIPEWGIFAVRDFAIFSYALLFVLSFIILDTPARARLVMRWFTYSGVLLAFLLSVDVLSGAKIFFDAHIRYVTQARIQVVAYGSGDVGGVISFSMAALIGYVLLERERRMFHLVCLAICFLGLAIGQTRAAVFGIGCAIVYSMVGMTAVQRMVLIALMTITTILLAGIAILMPDSSIANTTTQLVSAVQGGASFTKDDNFLFRFLRWDAVIQLWLDNPILGVGFGQPLIPSWLIKSQEAGMFNAGLPHNTFLTVLARMGCLGFVLVIGPWVYAICKATVAAHRGAYRADAFAAGMALTTMLGYSNFVLFIERPMHAAALWMVCAIACRLTQKQQS